MATNTTSVICRICSSSSLVESYYPDAHFNEKIFKYLKCRKCDSFNVFPSPNEEDFKKMYGEEDHYYLKDVKGQLQYDFNYPFAHHQGYQIQFLEQIKNDLKGKTLLDYACGSGFYMKYAETLGAKVVGVEFDKKFVTLLREKTDLDIYTFSEMKLKFAAEVFDFIHLGHILEHLPEPFELLEELRMFAHKDTVFIIDGPLERNSCLHRFYVDLGSRLKRKKYRDAVPQHLTLTTQKSQLLFFNRAGLKKEKYIVVEQYFPLPSKLEFSFGKMISFFIASFSILLSKIVPKYGNVFHYRGKINDL
ncbi:MAG: class I SAM-dependent methyltransferase [Vicingus serpentipes]|nr:class I SAM-dependent methyltransferase [Vicingus serpentipes]